MTVLLLLLVLLLWLLWLLLLVLLVLLVLLLLLLRPFGLLLRLSLWRPRLSLQLATPTQLLRLLWVPLLLRNLRRPRRC